MFGLIYFVRFSVACSFGSMKKILMILAIGGACSFSAMAQVDIGTKLGGVTTMIRNNTSFSEKTRLSYQAGLYLSIEPIPFFSVQTEFLYNRTRVNNQHGEGKLESGLKGMGYWSVPVVFQIRPVSFLRLGAGPQWNFHTNPGKYKLTDEVNAFKNFTSLVFDAQLKISSSTRIYARFNQGLKSFENLNDGINGKINRFEFGLQQSLLKK